MKHNAVLKRIRIALPYMRPSTAAAMARSYWRIVIGKETLLRNLQLAVTYECGYSCVFCSARGLKGTQPLLSVAEIASLATTAKRLGCIHVNLTGGEPLLRQEIDEIVAVLAKKNLVVQLISNGALFDGVTAQRLKRRGLSAVAISIYGDEGTHNRLTGSSDAYGKAVEALEVATRYRFIVSINTVISRHFIDHNMIEPLSRLAAKLGVFIQPILMCSPAPDNGSLTPQEFEKLQKIVDHPLVKPLHSNYWDTACPAGREYLYIGAYGDVMMCDLVRGIFGNVRTLPLEAIWGRMIAQRQKYEKKTLCLGLLVSSNRRLP